MVLPASALLFATFQGHDRFTLVGYWQAQLGAKSGRPDGFILYKDGRIDCRRDDEWGCHRTSGTYTLVGNNLTISRQKHFIDGKPSPAGFTASSTTHPIKWESKDSFGWVFDSKHTATFRRVDAATLERTLFVGEWVTIATTSGKGVGKGHLWLKADGTFRVEDGDTSTGTFSVADQGKTVVLVIRSYQGKRVPANTPPLRLSYNAQSDTIRDLMTVVYQRVATKAKQSATT